MLLWTDEDRGVGFMLLTGDTELDLIRVAESVRPDPDLKPTNEDRYQLALEELGDYHLNSGVFYHIHALKSFIFSYIFALERWLFRMKIRNFF